MRLITGLALAAVLTACQPAALLPTRSPATAIVGVVRAAARHSQASGGDIVSQATIALSDPLDGRMLASSLTDAQGHFTLAFPGLVPSAGSRYVLDAIKGLAEGADPNRPGAPAVRLRTLLVWNGGWQSLTNQTLNQGIVISPQTTALALATSYLAQAGAMPSAESLVGVLASEQYAPEVPGIPASTYTSLVQLVGQALVLDQDPLADIGRDAQTGTYRLDALLPWVGSYLPATPAAQSNVTVYGAQFENLPGRAALWLGGTPLSTWSVSADRTRLQFNVPAAAQSGSLTMVRAGGLVTTLIPFLPIAGTVATLAGAHPGFADGAGAQAAFNQPGGCALALDGALLVADGANGRLRRVAPTGVVSTLAGGAPGTQDGPLATAGFSLPWAVTCDEAGRLYLLDGYYGHIRRIADGEVQTMDSSGHFYRNPGNPLEVNGARSLAVDHHGTLYVADPNQNRVLSLNGAINVLGGQGGSQDGPLAEGAGFSQPLALAVDANDRLYVAQADGRIRRLNAMQTIESLSTAGTFAVNPGNPVWSQASALAIGTQGELYFFDASAHRLMRADTLHGLVAVAGSVNAVVDGPLAVASFGEVRGLAVRSDGALYLLESDVPSVRVVVP